MYPLDQSIFTVFTIWSLMKDCPVQVTELVSSVGQQTLVTFSHGKCVIMSSKHIVEKTSLSMLNNSRAVKRLSVIVLRSFDFIKAI